MQIIDVPIKGFGDILVDETAGTLTFEIKGTVLGTPEDFKFQLPMAQLMTGILSGVTNPVLKWLLGMVLSVL